LRDSSKVDCAQIKANLISNIYVINTFLDLIRNGKEKKIIYISSPSGDVEFNRITGISTLLGYSASKAGMNVIITKFGVELAQYGIKTLSLSPGWVNTDAGQLIERRIVSAYVTNSEQLKRSRVTRSSVNSCCMHFESLIKA
jgi:NAD(P)-dependent dehydrogenase (short-subunit alcohol dehydrogenase family)